MGCELLVAQRRLTRTRLFQQVRVGVHLAERARSAPCGASRRLLCRRSELRSLWTTRCAEALCGPCCELRLERGTTDGFRREAPAQAARDEMRPTEPGGRARGYVSGAFLGGGVAWGGEVSGVASEGGSAEVCGERNVCLAGLASTTWSCGGAAFGSSTAGPLE